jgi:hypothetical protein
MGPVERAKGILLNPSTEWRAVEPEPGNASYLFRNYVEILAAIPAVCSFIGMSIVGVNMPMFGTYRVGILAGIVSAILRYLLSFVMVYMMAYIVDALAATFEGQKNLPDALKLAVYAMTPVWLAGVFSLIPSLRMLGILGLYSLYLVVRENS